MDKLYHFGVIALLCLCKFKIVFKEKSILKIMDRVKDLNVMVFTMIALKMTRKKKRKIWVYDMTGGNVLESNAVLEKWNTCKFWKYSTQH